MTLEKKLEFPGAVEIERLQLVSTRGIVVDLDDYLVELNIYEDIFAPALNGTIILSDKLNLIEKLPIVGEELLLIKLTTPTFVDSIEKTFRVVKITDKNVVLGQNAHLYTLHFVSQEMALDVNAPIFKSFEGSIDDVIVEIFEDYVAMSRNLEEDKKTLVESAADTPLKILTETKNKVKFVSPGWSAFRCINWLASKSIPKEGKACNFLFWESNKCFYFASMETIFTEVNENKKYAGVYYHTPNNIRTGAERDVVKEMFITESVETILTVDHLKNYQSGYLSNRLIELDLVNKKYTEIDYDHTEKFYDYYHMSGKTQKEALPFFAKETMKNPTCSISYYPKHEKLFNDIEENVNEVYKDIHGNRLSNLLELDNFKIQITVPGRTDMEVGQMIYLYYPLISPTDQTDAKKEKLDPFLTGAYLITAIRHQINATRHKMIMELTKDSMTGDLK